MKERLSALKNASIVSLSTYAESAIGLFAGIVIARHLGPSDMGHYAFAVWLCGWLMTASNHGLPTSAVKFIAESRGAGDTAMAGRIAYRAVVLQRASSAAVLFAFSLVAVIAPPDDWGSTLTIMLPLAISAVLARSTFWMYGSVGKGFDRFEPENIAVAVVAVINVALIGLWSFVGGGKAGYFAIFSVTGWLMYAGVRLGLARYRIQLVREPLPSELSHRFHRHLLLTSALVVLGLGSNRAIEIALLKTFASASELAFFVIAGSLTKGAVEFLAAGLSATLLPSMARAFGSGSHDRVMRMLVESFRLYWIIGLVVAGLGAVVAPGLVRALYGIEYAPAIPTVVASLVIAGLTTVGAAINAFQTSSDGQSDRVKVTLISLAANAIAGGLFIPAFGLPGAIATLAVARVTGLVVSWWFLSQRVQFKPPYRLMGRALLASACAAACGYLPVLLFGGLGGAVLAGIVFCAAFLLLSVVFQAFTGTDYEVVRHLVVRVRPATSRLVKSLDSIARRFSAKLE